MGQVCDVCAKDMDEAAGCIGESFHYDRVLYTPIKFGEEKHKALRLQLGDRYEAFMAALTEPDRCPDCNSRRGEFHHPGCDNEECPKCGFQAIGCSCNDDYDGGPI
jgi:hypothetical protein